MEQITEIQQPESTRFELEDIGISLRSSFQLHHSVSRKSSISLRSTSIRSGRDEDDDEYELQWAAIERLETLDRTRKSVLNIDEKKVVDVSHLGAVERRLLIEKLIKHIENDNLRLLSCPSQ